MNAVAEIFRVGGAEPSQSAGAQALIAGLEQQIGASIPGIFRQSLLLANGEELLHRFSYCDAPIPFVDLGRVPAHWSGYDPFQHKVLPFMHENQGVCTWAVPFDEGEDPRVLVEVDSGVPPKWQTAAKLFSVWLQCQVADWQVLQALALLLRPQSLMRRVLHCSAAASRKVRRPTRGLAVETTGSPTHARSCCFGTRRASAIGG